METSFRLFSSSCYPFLFITLVFINNPLSICFDFYNSCSNLFDCGNISGVSYPFWGGNRPRDCGHPGFELSCKNSIVTMEMKDLVYRVLHVDENNQILRIAREDFMGGICEAKKADTILDFDLFDYSLGYVNMTLVYGCPPLVALPGQFDCPKDGDFDTHGYIKIGNVSSECEKSIVVPVPYAFFTGIGNSTTLELLEPILKEGFKVKWKEDSSECKACDESMGKCGYDFKLNQMTCFCQNQFQPSKVCASSLPGAPSGQPGSGSVERSRNQQAALQIGIAVGGACIALLVVSAIFFVRRRKQAKAKQLSLPQSTSKDISTPPSSKEIPTSVTNYSRSTPSYLSSKSDLEKGSTYFGVQVFSYIELEEATDNFDPKRELGDGGFGTVYYGELKDGRVVAVKRLYENNFKRVEQFMNEVEILTRLRHENLVTLYGCTSRRSRELLLVYEYIPNGTVADHLHGNRSSSGLLTWPVRLNIALETAVALAYLHASEIIHRDVKSNNILLDNDFRVKVADFGLSRLFPTDVTHISTAPQGTPGYVDPEYYQCYQLTVKSDVYSFGVVLIELISSKQAVDTSRHRHDINLANMAVNKIQNQTLDELVDSAIGFDKDYAVRRMVTLVAELAFRCLQQERDMRPSMEEIVEVLRGIQNEELNAQKAEVVDIADDDVGLLKSIPPPLSPDSASTDKWMKIRTM